MKKIVAATVTVLLLGAALVGMSLQSRGRGTDNPEACLERMFDAMRAGDAAAYLDCFAGELRAELERSARAEAPARFADYLRQTAEPIRGRAVLQHKTQSPAPDLVRLVVDRVYAKGRPWEYQGYRLRRSADGWKIYAMDAVEPHEPPVPYGTPAFPGAEEREPAAGTAPASPQPPGE